MFPHLNQADEPSGALIARRYASEDCGGLCRLGDGGAVESLGDGLPSKGLTTERTDGTEKRKS